MEANEIWNRRTKWLFLLAIIVLLLPHAIRTLSGNNVFIGKDAYSDIKTANNVLEGKQDFKEVTAYQILIIFLVKFLKTDALLRVIPLILGILTLFFCEKFLKAIKLKARARFFVILCLVLSSFFVSTFTISSQRALTAFLFVALLYAIYKKFKGKIINALSLLLALSGFWNALYTGTVLFACSRSKRIKKEKIILPIAIILLSLLVVYLPQAFIEKPNFIETKYLKEFLSDFGGINGIGTFSIMLAFAGLLKVWKFKRKNYFLYASSLVVFVASFFFNELITYSQLIIIFLAGMGFNYFYKTKWEAEYLKQAFILVLFCGLLFSTVSDAINVAQMQPNQKKAEAFLWLKENTARESIVFSDYRNGLWIEYFGDKAVVLNERMRKNSNEKYEDSYTLLNTYDMKQAKDIINKHGINYVVITKNMFEGDVWEREDKGLHFLLSNKENFKLKFNNSNVWIWKYIGANVVEE